MQIPPHCTTEPQIGFLIRVNPHLVDYPAAAGIKLRLPLTRLQHGKRHCRIQYIIRITLGIAAFVLVVCPVLAAVPEGNHISSFRLVGPTGGWILEENHLLWSGIQAGEKDDISPVLESGEQINAVYFLTRSQGWCLLTKAVDDSEQPFRFSIVSTMDNGRTWNRIGQVIPDSDFSQSYGAQAKIYFVDGSHGWIELLRTTGSSFSAGVLLVTSDGGHTWKALPNPPIYGDIQFDSPAFGWLVGGVLGHELYLTKDGGVTWTLTATPPKPDSEKTYYQFGFEMPKFLSPEDAILPVWFDSDADHPVAPYSTHDGGKTWQLTTAEVLPHQCAAVTWLADSHLKKIVWGSGCSVPIKTDTVRLSTAIPAGLPTDGAVADVSFLDDRNGWILFQGLSCPESTDGCTLTRALLATLNGGATMKVIEVEKRLVGRPRSRSANPVVTPLFNQGPTFCVGCQGMDRCPETKTGESHQDR